MTTESTADKGVSTSVKEGPSWVPLKEASERTGVSVSTLRTWYRKGRIEARTVKGPNGEQKLVRLDEVEARRTPRAKAEPPSGSEVGVEAEWIPLRDAAALASVSISTLRNWYRKGLVESRMVSGSNGDQRMVRKDQVEARSKASSNGRSSNGASALAEDAQANGSSGSELVPVARALPDLIKELADARERAGRAEAKVEFLSEQLSETRARAESLEQRVAENVTPSPSTAEALPTPEAVDEPDDLEDDLPLDFPREEDDEYLALVQRWRARRKRRRMLKRAAKARSS